MQIPAGRDSREGSEEARAAVPAERGDGRRRKEHPNIQAFKDQGAEVAVQGVEEEI